MPIRLSSTLLLARSSRLTARPTFLRSLTPQPPPAESHRHLTTSGRPASVSLSSASTSPADAAKEHEIPPFLRKPPNPDRPIVEYYDPRKNCLRRRNIRVSAGTDADILTAAISPLLAAGTQSFIETRSVGSKGWKIETSGIRTGLVRYLAFDTGAEATKFPEAVRAADDEMDHHPEIATLTGDASVLTYASTLTYVAVLCRTHRPPGLSLKDLRLARKIDELADAFNYMAREDDKEPVVGFLRLQRHLFRRELKRSAPSVKGSK